MWTKDSLKKVIQEKLGKDHKLILASNREPYIHEYSGTKLNWSRAISGLTIALDPVMQTCNGIWVAHGSGDGDQAVVDKYDKIKVPPDKPRYTLKRVWLTKEEEDGYYNGYANQALWPLSHIVYQMPSFLPDHWEYYKKVNERFARAILPEVKNQHASVWLQDYHLTLCARYIKEASPDTKVSLFWHIPWPNPEAFRICPQKKEILEGLLANDLLGFHIKYYCDNFMATVKTELEAKVDWEDFSITYKGHKTLVKSFPISVDAEGIAQLASSAAATKRVKNIPQEIDPVYKTMALSIDRVDYTKGIIQKMKAVDRFLEKYPKYVGNFIYVQLGVLSRIRIKAYKQLIDDIQGLAGEINWKYKSGAWYPIVLVNKRIDYLAQISYYRAADLCLVGSLHDGMNLVAKEYIMANTDNRGMLVLSQFTGSARELKDAVLVNPYDLDGFARGIRRAIEMSPQKKREKLKKMKEVIGENNIYYWAGQFINELVKL